VIAARVGSFPEDLLEGQTGFLFRPGDAVDLAEKIALYFESNLYREFESRSWMIREYGVERFSWERNADLTARVYQSLL
jgi:glycosyltransferase involved in cell wall biosynthesis